MGLFQVIIISTVGSVFYKNGSKAILKSDEKMNFFSSIITSISNFEAINKALSSHSVVQRK